MILNIGELENICNVIIQELRNHTVKLEFENDYYWWINPQEIIEMSIPPSDLTIGQISFDLEDIRKLFDPNYYPIFSDIKLLGVILRAISSELDFKDKKVYIELSIDDLEKIIEIILNRIKESSSNIVFKNGNYWYIDNKEMFNVLQDPSSFAIGQISNDIEYFRNNIKNPGKELPKIINTLGKIINIIANEFES